MYHDRDTYPSNIVITTLLICVLLALLHHKIMDVGDKVVLIYIEMSKNFIGKK